MRPFVQLLAVFALLLALVPGSDAHAQGMGTVMSQLSAADCTSSVATHGKAERHDGGDRAKDTCCLGAICVFSALPATVALAPILSAAAPALIVADGFLTGRDIPPPFDPPRLVA